MRLFLVLALTLGLAACGDDTPSCEQVADHVASLSKSSGSPIEAASRDVLVDNCKAESGKNAKFRRCVMKATDLDGAKKCELEAAFEHMNR